MLRGFVFGLISIRTAFVAKKRNTDTAAAQTQTSPSWRATTELEWTSQTHVLLRSLSQTPAAGRVGQAGVGSGRAARAALAPHPSAPAAASSASASAARAARPPMRRQRRDRGVVAGAQSGAPLHVRLQRRVRRSLPPPTSTKPGPTTAPSHSPLGASPVHPPARQALALPASPLTLFPYHFLPTGAAAGVDALSAPLSAVKNDASRGGGWVPASPSCRPPPRRRRRRRGRRRGPIRGGDAGGGHPAASTPTHRRRPARRPRPQGTGVGPRVALPHPAHRTHGGGDAGAGGAPHGGCRRRRRAAATG